MTDNCTENRPGHRAFSFAPFFRRFLLPGGLFVLLAACAYEKGELQPGTAEEAPEVSVFQPAEPLPADVSPIAVSRPGAPVDRTALSAAVALLLADDPDRRFRVVALAPDLGLPETQQSALAKRLSKEAGYVYEVLRSAGVAPGQIALEARKDAALLEPEVRLYAP